MSEAPVNYYLEQIAKLMVDDYAPFGDEVIEFADDIDFAIEHDDKEIVSLGNILYHALSQKIDKMRTAYIEGIKKEEEGEK